MGVKEDRLKVKQLEKSIAQCKDDVSVKQKALSAGQRELAKFTSEYGRLIAKLTKDTPKKPNVSDHALLRYLEKKYNIDSDKLREEILTPLCIQSIQAGAGSVKVDGMKFQISDKTIVTVI